jgi:hypothetical protein
MRCAVRRGLALGCILFGAGFAMYSQTSLPSPHKTVSQSSRPKPERKLTARQTRGMQLLETAEAEARGMDAEMRAFLLWEISHAYRKLYPARSRVLLREAFESARGIPDDQVPDGCANCVSKPYLEVQTLRELAAESPSAVQDLITLAEPEVRRQVDAQLARIIRELVTSDSQWCKVGWESWSPTQGLATCLNATSSQVTISESGTVRGHTITPATLTCN